MGKVSRWLWWKEEEEEEVVVVVVVVVVVKGSVQATPTATHPHDHTAPQG